MKRIVALFLSSLTIFGTNKKPELIRWLLPEDAERITKSCNSGQRVPHRTVPNQQLQMLSDTEDEDLNAAIAASLMDSSSPAMASDAIGPLYNENKNSTGQGL
ncbi:hypothetical protein LOK49_LG10G02087 [Camellia lanceoleosa]|uniref:Uncharacterized protein n=1 Tax=Camellia lanceoleosa TaxID=1840588 RepID=A0ACC0GBT5_9ERIC|nr:hypothetical protein LOK49_LG10G02087 [Camellia lanceoleosa]